MKVSKPYPSRMLLYATIFDVLLVTLVASQGWLMSALAKISYGAAAGRGEGSGSMVKALYFAEPSGARNVAEITNAIGSGNDAKLAEAIENEKRRGGLELLMTHPLTAKRLEALLKIKREIGG